MIPSARHLLVGEAPAADRERAHLDVILALRAVGLGAPIGGVVRLARDLGYLAREAPRLLDFVDATAHVNVLDEWPGSRGTRKGSEFPLAPARERAREMLEEIAEAGPSVVLLAGLRVAAAFGLGPKTPYFSPAMVAGGATFAVVPHPSGVSRWWNSKANARAARAFLETLGSEAHA